MKAMKTISRMQSVDKSITYNNLLEMKIDR